MTPTLPSSHTPIPYGRQSIDESDIAAVVEVLRSDWLTQGPRVAEFERSLAHYCGVTHAVAVANGTAALHLAMLAAGVQPGDRVITSANTFLASANCAEFVGATADFADIDPRSLCVSAETLDAAWQSDVKAIVPVDFAGWPCVSREMADLAHERGAVVIEDAAHAIGASRDGYKVGGLPWVDMTTFSFHPVKTMTTGEGGAILTNDDALAERCRTLRTHGMVRPRAEGGNLKPADNNNPSGFRSHPSSLNVPWYYEMAEVGYNYRITDMQCALGLSQLKKLDGFVRRRQEIVDQYNEAFSNLPHTHTPIHPYPHALHPAWHLYTLQIDFPMIGKSRADCFQRLEESGIRSQVHYIPVHRQPYYRDKYGYGPGKCPAAETYYERAISLPLFPAMRDEDVASVIRAVSDFLPEG